MKISKPKKFAAIKRRVLQLHANHAHLIKSGGFISLSTECIPEFVWLVEEIERLNGAMVPVTSPRPVDPEPDEEEEASGAEDEDEKGEDEV